MRYIVFSFDGYGLPIAWQLQQEGRDVLVAMVEDQQDTVCELERNVPPEDEEIKARRLSLYDGLLEKRPARKVLETLLTAKNAEETFLFFDLNHLFAYSEQLQGRGFKGNFPTQCDYLLEIDRDRAKSFVDSNYPQIHVAQKHKFKRAAEARRFLKGTEDLWVLKGLAEDARTIVPDVEDPELAKSQILDALAQHPEEYEAAGFLLELLVPAALELTPERMYYDGEPITSMLCVENKPLGAGNLGPMTDCAADVMFATELTDRINAIAFPPVVDAMARERQGLFVWDASLLIDGRTGKLYFGEFCANRVGYNSFYTELALAGSAGKYFETIAQGKNPFPDNSVAASIRLFNLHKNEGGHPLPRSMIEFKERVHPDLWLTDVHKDRGRWVSAGYKETIGIMTGVGHSLSEAAKRAYRHIDDFSFEGAYYRPMFDLLSRDYKTSIPNRIDYGLQRGFYKIGFGF